MDLCGLLGQAFPRGTPARCSQVYLKVEKDIQGSYRLQGQDICSQSSPRRWRGRLSPELPRLALVSNSEYSATGERSVASGVEKL